MSSNRNENSSNTELLIRTQKLDVLGGGRMVKFSLGEAPGLITGTHMVDGLWL